MKIQWYFVDNIVLSLKVCKNWWKYLMECLGHGKGTIKKITIADVVIMMMRITLITLCLLWGKVTKSKMEKIGNLVCSLKDPWLNDSISFRSKGTIILKWHNGGRSYLPRDRHEAESNVILLTSSLLFPPYYIYFLFNFNCAKTIWWFLPCPSWPSYIISHL